MAYQGKKQYKNAKADLEALLEIDPGNRRAKVFISLLVLKHTCKALVLLAPNNLCNVHTYICICVMLV